MAKKRKKENKLVTVVLTLVAAILVSLFLAIPLMLVGYTWMMYALKEIPLWIAIVTSALCSLAESLLLVSELRD
jgi:uncharacterized protein involved in cysteine biosynthesis